MAGTAQGASTTAAIRRVGCTEQSATCPLHTTQIVLAQQQTSTSPPPLPTHHLTSPIQPPPSPGPSKAAASSSDRMPYVGSTASSCRARLTMSCESEAVSMNLSSRGYRPSCSSEGKRAATTTHKGTCRKRLVSVLRLTQAGAAALSDNKQRMHGKHRGRQVALQAGNSHHVNSKACWQRRDPYHSPRATTGRQWMSSRTNRGTQRELG